MVGPPPHVIPPPLVPPSVEPLSSSSPDLVSSFSKPIPKSQLSSSSHLISDHLPPPSPLPPPPNSSLPSYTISQIPSPIPAQVSAFAPIYTSSHLLSSDLTTPASDLTSFSVLAPDPAAAAPSAGQFSSVHPSLSQLPRRRASQSSSSAAGSSSLAAARPTAGSAADLPSSVQHLPPLSPRHGALSSSSPSSSSAQLCSSSAELSVRPQSGQPDLALLSAATLRLGQQGAAVPGPSSTSVFPLLSPASQATSFLGPIPLPVQQPLSAQASHHLPSMSIPVISSSPTVSVPPPPTLNSQLPSPLPHQLGSFAQAAPPSGLAPRSYAQVSKPSKGTGFVRTHANEIESFARLPRTGTNIICGHREGIPSFSFVNSDLPSVEDLFSNALVMKFHGGRPSLEVSHKEIRSWGLEQPFTIGPLTSRSFLLRFQDQKDLIRVLSRPSTLLISFSYKIFKWHNLCHLSEDSCFAPVWISLPRI